MTLELKLSHIQNKAQIAATLSAVEQNPASPSVTSLLDEAFANRPDTSADAIARVDDEDRGAHGGEIARGGEPGQPGAGDEDGRPRERRHV